MGGQIIDILVAKGALIVDVDNNNIPLFTDVAKESWYAKNKETFISLTQNPFEDPSNDPIFEVRPAYYCGLAQHVFRPLRLLHHAL